MKNFAAITDDSLVSCPDARQHMLAGVSRTTEWRWIKSGILPEPIKLGHRSRYWRMGDLRRVLAAMGA